MLVHDFLAMRNQSMRDSRPQTAGGSVAGHARGGDRAGGRAGGRTSERGLRWVIAGAAVTLSAALFGAAGVASGDTPSLIVKLSVMGGLVLLAFGLFS